MKLGVLKQSDIMNVLTEMFQSRNKSEGGTDRRGCAN